LSHLNELILENTV